jgi:hypothetical protein
VNQLEKYKDNLKYEYGYYCIGRGYYDISEIKDADVLVEFANLLNYLETQFTFIIMISHIESSRDMAKKLIEISKNNGFSKIYFE